MNDSVPLAVHSSDISVVRQQESDQLYIAGDDGQMQGGEAFVVAALQKIGGGHDEEVSSLGSRDAVRSGAVVERRFSGAIALRQRERLQKILSTNYLNFEN